MVILTLYERQKLIDLLKMLPDFATENARRQILEYAGLKQLSPGIDLSGSSFNAVSTIVNSLCDYGRLTYENEALGLLLNSVKSLVGVEKQEFLDSLLIKYNMMTPIALFSDTPQWQIKETMADILEKIIGENTLRPIAFLAQGLHVAQSVAYISVLLDGMRWSGTGFLIAPDILLTNNHVVPKVDSLSNLLIRFNYQDNFKGESQQPSEYRAKLNGIFHTNKNLDYTIFQVEGSPGTQWGWLPFRLKEIRKDDRVNIIQHPNGQPKQLSMQNNFVEYVGNDVVQYVTSTLAGSSGSPVLNNNWELVAVHHAGGILTEPSTQRRYFRNEGILVTSILADLPDKIRRMIKGGDTSNETES